MQKPLFHFVVFELHFIGDIYTCIVDTSIGVPNMQVYASDAISTKIRPPPIDDGTPNESVADVFARVRQLMSILETQYSGDTVVIVSPDSDNLSILNAGLIGLDLRR